MAIIGTLPSRFSDKKQQLYKGSLIEHVHKSSEVERNGLTTKNEGVTSGSILRSLEHQSAIFFCL
jgi:hypothetical protein